MNKTAFSTYFSHILLSAGVSGMLIAVLIHAATSSTEPSVWPSLVAALAGVPLLMVVLYCAAVLVRSVLGAFRYGLLLKASEPAPPGFFHLFLVTVSRNMFVDMLPARLGELSYIAMLNRGYSVSAQSCLSSLAVSFVFDLMALSVMVAGIILYQLLTIGLQLWVVGVLGMLIVVIAVLLLFLFPVLEYFATRVARTSWGSRGFAGRMVSLLRKTATALQQTRKAGILGRLLVLSLGIRLSKYLGLYCLFFGVVATHFADISTHPVSVLIALVSAEAGASLPVPTFMSFGTYEATGMLAMVALGASQSASLVIMLGLHILSQMVDYTLGGIALITFLVRTGSLYLKKGASFFVLNKRYLLISFFLFCGGMLFLAVQIKGLQKQGSLVAPDSGEVVPVERNEGLSENFLDEAEGFVVWSSNRFGNHDILKLTLPGREIVRLTTHPHTEYYPRIDPDGRRIVFARSRQPWVSQRNYYAWDIYLLDLESGAETLVAENGNVPTWSADGGKVYFQREGNQVVEIDLRSGAEKVLFHSGVNVQVPGSVILQTPMVSEDGTLLAATLREGRRETAVIDSEGNVRSVGGGCQLSWGPGDAYLYAIDHGGRKQNAVYRIDPDGFQRELWFDAPGEYSHEYFPRVSNDGRFLVYGASREGHEHDTADYEIFLWRIGSSWTEAVRLTYHTGNDCWPDIFLRE
ncbi:MAG: lysylphosphatidylglycerol synthase domain-containing protein [Desulfobulbaceae bacterium]|nr:lysylphosphatidylglycerol synthase domain-containing protein [Desulfobulbaceae bacterium]